MEQPRPAQILITPRGLHQLVDANQMGQIVFLRVSDLLDPQVHQKISQLLERRRHGGSSPKASFDLNASGYQTARGVGFRPALNLAAKPALMKTGSHFQCSIL